MGLEFIDRTLRTTGIVALILLPFSLYYFGVWPTLAAFSGAVWSMLNLLFLTGLIKSTLRPEGADKMTAIALLLVKFPLLYVAGYFLLKIRQFEPMYLLIGFSFVLVIMVLKVLGRLFVGMNHKSTTKTLQGAA